MTGTASGVSKTFMDFDTYRNQEWLRRRKLRLEQVRKQSNEIAKAIRQKVISGEKARIEEYERMSEANFRDWKAEKLTELEWKLRSALEEFGDSHRQAQEESESEEIIMEKNKINLAKAQRRGEIAKQEELKKRKMIEEKKKSPIQRKQLTRKKEDLRSALVCSVFNKKHLFDSEEVSKKKLNPEKASIQKKVNRKKMMPHKSCLCKCKTPSKSLPSKEPGTIWINLNDIQTCQTSDSGQQMRMSKSSISNGKSLKGKPEGTVEFYDFSSRYHSRSFREFPHSVERIDSESEGLNANEMAELEEEKEKEAAKKKMEIDALRQERGMEALKKEKIQRNYNDMIAKLEKLNKKEKILKAQQRSMPAFFYMNDERLSERTRTKQRMMDAKFESIYYEATMQVPQSEQPHIYLHGGGDCPPSDDGQSIRLSFSPSKIKPNSPVTSRGESSRSTSPDDMSKRPRKTKEKQQLLLDIDRALKEGRELRKTTPRNWDPEPFEDEEQPEYKKSSSDSETLKTRDAETSPPKSETKMISQESQTDDLKDVIERAGKEELKSFDKAGDESLPVSSSTSYKSPPSVIKSSRLRQFLASLEKNSEIDLEENQDKPLESLTLEYYIEKLLNMSRECVANLSVSSVNISTPNITDLDAKDEKASDLEYSCPVSSQEEDVTRQSTLNRAIKLEEVIKNWRRILGKTPEKNSDPEDVPDFPNFKEKTEAAENKTMALPLNVTSRENVKNKYEEITKKCSERISELSDMLDKVRRDKEKLLGSTSEDSSPCLNKDERTSEKESDEDDEGEEGVQSERKTNSLNEQRTSPALESFINRYNLSRPREKTAAEPMMADSQSFVGSEDSLDSWPDVMNELLKKEILTSPFKWSDGEHSSELTRITDVNPKFTSIETAIGNFRKEIKKIKPFSLTDSFLQCDPQAHSRYFSDVEQLESFSSLRKRTPTEREPKFQDEGSVDSINQALTSLGLNWAKSFLRKNEESRAMSSSSNSGEKFSGDENDFQ